MSLVFSISSACVASIRSMEMLSFLSELCLCGLRIEKYNDFKDFKKRILVATDLFGRGIDIERVNIVINYDFPNARKPRDDAAAADVKSEHPSDQYLHRVGRAGRFGTKGLAISFIAGQDDADQLASVQSRFEVDIPVIPDQIDVNSYMS